MYLHLPVQPLLDPGKLRKQDAGDQPASSGDKDPVEVGLDGGHSPPSEAGPSVLQRNTYLEEKPLSGPPALHQGLMEGVPSLPPREGQGIFPALLSSLKDISTWLIFLSFRNPE